MIGTPKPICRHPLENTVTVTLTHNNSIIYQIVSDVYLLFEGLFYYNQVMKPITPDSSYSNLKDLNRC